MNGDSGNDFSPPPPLPRLPFPFLIPGAAGIDALFGKNHEPGSRCGGNPVTTFPGVLISHLIPHVLSTSLPLCETRRCWFTTSPGVFRCPCVSACSGSTRSPNTGTFLVEMRMLSSEDYWIADDDNRLLRRFNLHDLTLKQRALCVNR